MFICLQGSNLSIAALTKGFKKQNYSENESNIAMQQSNMIKSNSCKDGSNETSSDSVKTISNKSRTSMESYSIMLIVRS